MAKRIEVIENQLVIPSHAEIVTAGEYPEIDPEKRISLARLTSVIGQTLTYGSEPDVLDYHHSELEFLRNGLYFHPTDSNYDTAQHVIRLGVRRNNNGKVTKLTGDFGVAFPPYEYPTVARNPHDLGQHTVNKTRLARWGGADTDEDAAAAMRSGGHMLIAKMHAQKLLTKRLEGEDDIIQSLLVDLRAPFRTRQKAKNLERKRALVDDKIHETIEVAAMNLPLNAIAIAAIHKVYKRKHYSGNYSQAERVYSWRNALNWVAVHTKAKLYKLDLSRAMSEQEMQIYQPFIDAKLAEEQRAQAA